MPPTNTCQLWVPMKNRYCRHPPAPNSVLCRMHNQQRIPCPVDPSHTIEPHKIESHRKKCPAYLALSKQHQLPYYSEGCCRLPHEEEEENQTALPEATLLDRLMVWWRASPYQNTIEERTTLQGTEDDNDHSIKRGEKHGIQMDTIIENLSLDEQEERDAPCQVLGIEMGAGKGTLSTELHERHPDWFHLLIDIRRNFKNKAESKSHVSQRHTDSEQACFARITMDIGDLLLQEAISYEFPFLQSPTIVIYAKHLCGVALDLALACITQSVPPQQLSRVVMASCCHHRCEWKSFVGKPFLRTVLGQCTAEDFAFLCKMTSWATSRNELDSAVKREDGTMYPRYVIGMICKYLLDEARRVYLSHYYSDRETSIKPFISSALSPENRLLLLR